MKSNLQRPRGDVYKYQHEIRFQLPASGSGLALNDLLFVLGSYASAPSGANYSRLLELLAMDGPSLSSFRRFVYLLGEELWKICDEMIFPQVHMSYSDII